jgi:5-formyltetrahydrofolate cyclo-ligase
MDIASQKQRLREAVSDRMKTLPERDRQSESRSLCRRVLENLPAGVKTVAAFYPMRSEADIVPLLQEFLKRGIRVFLPRMEGKTFSYRLMTSMETLAPGSLRIPEPDSDAPVLDEKELDLALIPGAAFDRDGNRLGRGNGGYDIWLEKARKENPGLKVWGVALDRQVVNVVPVQPHDRPVDAVVTQRELMKTPAERH